MGDLNNVSRLGVYLKAFRMRKNMTQNEVARRTGVTTNTVHKWETSFCRPSLRSLSILAEMMELPLSELVRMSGGDEAED